MNTYHDIYSWSTQYRRERLHEAETRRLEARLRQDRRVRSWRGGSALALGDVLAWLLRRTRLAGKPLVGMSQETHMSHLRDASSGVWPGERVRFGFPAPRGRGTEETEIGTNQLLRASERERGREMFMRPEEARIGKRVRVRNDLRTTDFRGQQGMIAKRWGNPGYPALDVLLDDGGWQLFWYHELEPLDEDDRGARRRNGATAEP